MIPGSIRSLQDAVDFARAIEPASLRIYVADWSGVAALCDDEELQTVADVDDWLRATSRPGPLLAERLEICYASPKLRQYWGQDHEELTQVFRRITEALGKEALRSALLAFTQGQPQMAFETPGGGENWIQPVWLVPATRSEPWGVTMLLDVEPQRAAEHEASRTEARYRAIVQDQTDFIVRYRPDGVRTFVNEAYANFFGGTPADYVGTSFLDLIAEEHRPEVVEKVRRLCEGEAEVLAEEHLSSRRDGALRWTQWIDRAIFDSGGNLVELQAVGRDVTEQRQAEEQRLRLERQLAQAQKMEAVGTLAGGLAHDFNNTLTAIGAYASLLRANTHDADKVARYADCLLEAAGQASELVTRLLRLSSRRQRHTGQCDVVEVLESAGRLLRGVLPGRIALSVEPGEPVYLWADASQLTQAILNLGVNARDAMSDGGALRVYSRRDGEHLVLGVQDDGTGIPPDVLERVFEPFFTTKPEGQGTGLGLAMVHACAEAHGGRVQVDSEVGVGTTVELRLPIRAVPMVQVTGQEAREGADV